MGAEKVTLVKDAASRQRHLKNLLRDLKALQLMLDNDLFENDVQRIGAEQEFCFVDAHWRPAPVIMEVLERVNDDHFTTELARFNMEVNLDPVLFQGDCLSALESTLRNYLYAADMAAQEVGARVLLCGILPTIRQGDINYDNLTPLPRYRALMELLHELHSGLFEFRIDGPDELVINDALALFEGSNTSFQVHLQLPAHSFASYYNWSMAVTGPLLSAATNSPLLLGKRGWRETRIALFQQSIDTRSTSEMVRERSPRVCFGTGWIEDSILDIFKDDIARHRVMLASTREEDPLQILAEGGVPKLYSLNVHNGTVYRWNRPCYGITDGKPHLRIEMRVLPTGPSIPDEIANAAFWLGMVKGMPDDYARMQNKMEFDNVKENFFRAARHGLGSYLWWGSPAKRIPASELLLKELIPLARTGLQKANVRQTDIDRYMDIIQERVESGRTGSQWQLSSLERLKKEGKKEEALVATTAAMFNRQQQDMPVHKWPIAGMEEAGSWANRYWTVEQIMSTDLFTVNENDPLDFAANLMDWRNVRHLPVENEKGVLVGFLTAKMLLRFYSQSENHPVRASVGQIMSTDLYFVTPEMSTIEAVHLMRERQLGYLPVMRNGNLIGLVTEYDFVNVAAHLMNEIYSK
ncbi:MAG: CBS domain-containing protein [Saprospiraceae bacterium]|nr:CBS domain-containing protein [Saprospiraceae bacterium]